MSKELKPCPFCRSAKISRQRDEDCCWHKCDSCGATGPLTTKRDDEDAPDWNTRAEARAPDVRELVEAAKLASVALYELQERASGFSVSGVYFDEPCFTENVDTLAKALAAEDAIDRALAAFTPAETEGKRPNPFGTGLSEPHYTAQEMQTVLGVAPTTPKEGG